MSSIDVLLPPRGAAYRKRSNGNGMAVFFGDSAAVEKKVDDIQRRVSNIEIWGALGFVATVLGALYVGRNP